MKSGGAPPCAIASLEAVVEVVGDGQEHFGLAGEVEVEGAAGDAGGGDDVGDGGGAVAALGEDGGGRYEELAASGIWLEDGSSFLACHLTRLTRQSSQCQFLTLRLPSPDQRKNRQRVHACPRNRHTPMQMRASHPASGAHAANHLPRLNDLALADVHR